jgi:Zn-dependent M28 family amino/carboxypeptidase
MPGSGVATILEVLRALRTGAPLQNDLLIVITDGEEEGLSGPRGLCEIIRRSRNASAWS